MSKSTEQGLNANEVSRISAGTVIKGDIDSPNDIRIDGSFEGRIASAGKVVAGEKAVIKGDVICANADFWGKMTGSFYVKGTLALKENSVVEGDLHVCKLVVELGARFDGKCAMLNEGEFEALTSTGRTSGAAEK